MELGFLIPSAIIIIIIIINSAFENSSLVLLVRIGTGNSYLPKHVPIQHWLTCMARTHLTLEKVVSLDMTIYIFYIFYFILFYLYIYIKIGVYLFVCFACLDVTML